MATANPTQPEVDRNWAAQAGITYDQFMIWVEAVTIAYKKIFACLLIGTVLGVILGVIANRAGMPLWNFIFAAVFLVVWLFLEFHPKGLLVVFGVGGLNGLPKDWGINQLIRDGKLPDLRLSEVVKQGFELIKKLSYYSAHVAFFVTVMFVVLGTFELKTASAVLPVFVLLAAIGLWSILAKVPAKWYFRITGLILLVSIVIFLYKGFVDGGDEVSASASTSEPAPKKGNSFKKAYADLTYKRTFDLEISSFQDVEMCGVRPGTRKFSVPNNDRGRIYVQVEGMRSDITSAIRLNGTLPGEEFEVEKNGCVTVSFAYAKGAKYLTIERRVINFTVE